VSRLDQLTSVAIDIQVDDKPSFLLSMTKEGTVRRMGYSALDSHEKTAADVEDATIFAHFVEGLPTDVLDHAGSQEVEGVAGERVVCRIELVGATETVTYEMIYSSESAGLSRYMALMVNLGEELTDEWYGTNLTLTPVLDLPPVQTPSPSAPAAPSTPPWEPPPPPPPPPAYEPPPEPVYEPPAAEEPEPESEEEVEVEVAEDVAASPPSRPRPSPRPKASKQRLAMVVLLDLFVITSAYGVVTLMTGRGLPMGAALFFLVLTEACLLQFLRMSPGYWLLGMRANVGAFPTVEPDQIARESLVTHIVATVLLILGVHGLTVWTHFQAPMPYFGFAWASWFTVPLTILIGAAFIASAVLIFRNDIRGVKIGGGVTAFGFLAVWFARGNTLNGWLRLELMRQREAEGRPVFNSLDLDPILGRVVPGAIVIALGCGVGLYFVWKQFTQPESVPPVSEKAQAS
jgi:hypothetical protein